MSLSRPATLFTLTAAWLLGVTLTARAQGTLQLRLAPTNNRVDLILDGNTNSGALFIYQSTDPRRLAPCPPVVVQANTPLTNGLRFSLPLSTRRFFQAAHWPGRPILDFTNQTMAYVPAGSFSMGDRFGEGPAQERPVHAVQVDGFWMDKHEVTLARWEEVRSWAVTNGYSFDFGAQGKASNHPVHSVTWSDAVKWCNARSEKEGRVPAYYTDATLGAAAVYRSGQVAVRNDWVNWAGGYRLPTEAEWEKAARGGAPGLRFPCQDTLSHAEANYYSSAAFDYDVSPTREYQPTYAVLPQPYTSPVGAFAPSGHGLFDLAGNVQEWCWDLHDPGYYSLSPATDPRGPSTGSARVFRGGSWSELASRSRVAYRGYGPPGLTTNNVGFRTVLPGVTYAAPPVVLTPPSGVTNLAGSTVQVSATLAGTPPLSLQWRKDAAALPGATNPILRFPGFGSQNAGAYDLVTTNVYGSATSSVAVLELALPPTITSQPQGRSNEVGTVATFSVTATGTAPLSYQWRRGGANLVEGGSVLGATTSTLALSVSALNGGAYDVVVRSPYASVTSAVAVLTLLLPPTLVQQPVNRTNGVGTTASFAVTASGTAPLAYQWRYAGAALTGATNGTLVLANVQTNQAGAYDVVVVNAYGSVTSSVAVLTVVRVPAITDSPTDRTNVVGTTASLAAGATGTAPLTYQWRYVGAALAGATNATLVLANVQANQAGAYDVVVANAYGSATSSVAVLTVVTVPAITQQPVSRTSVVGTTASFAVTASGTAPLVYQWRYAGAIMVGATNGTLLLPNVQTNQAGPYDVVVANAYGSVTSGVAVLTVVKTPPVPSGMVLIPAGSYAMGDTLDGSSYALPVHTVDVGALYMDRTEVTKAQWDEVYGWAITNGYSFDYAESGQGKAPMHPAHTITWYDAVKWCNARSEKEGRVPAYYTDATLTGVYRSGQVSVQNDWVRWTGGYRLPTEAEWEKAARGGVAGQRFGFGDTITHGQANYYSRTNEVYDVSPTRGYHPTYNDGVYPYTSPVGSFGANGYGLCDMAGNVWEWCWDWYDSTYYGSSPTTDPRGPATGSNRVLRGGSWYDSAIYGRSAYRNSGTPGNRVIFDGFRAVLSPGQP